MAEIVLEHVNKSYPDGATAVKDLNITIADGEFLILVGPSGCGKTTTLNMIAGLEDISSGELRIGGERVNEKPPKDRDIAMVFQSYALYPHMTVRQNIAFPLTLAKMKKADIAQKVEETAETLDLTALLDRKPSQLSGGQRQRVAMGRAIVRHPKAFLMDEPLSNLDAKLRVQMRLELELLHRRLGTTCLYVTHDQVEAITLADRMMVLNAGVVEQIGTPQEVYRTPASRFVAGFIGSPSMNLIPARRTRTGDILVDAAADPQPGSFTLGVRPEHLVPCPEADALLVVAVNVVENLGADSFAYGSIGSQEVVVRLPGEHQVSPGDRLPVRASQEHLHCFDAETDRRVDLQGHSAGMYSNIQ